MGLKRRGRYPAHSVSAFEITRFSRTRRGGEKVPGGATGGGNGIRTLVLLVLAKAVIPVQKAISDDTCSLAAFTGSAAR